MTWHCLRGPPDASLLLAHTRRHTMDKLRHLRRQVVQQTKQKVRVPTWQTTASLADCLPRRWASWTRRLTTSLSPCWCVSLSRGCRLATRRCARRVHVRKAAGGGSRLPPIPRASDPPLAVQIANKEHHDQLADVAKARGGA